MIELLLSFALIGAPNTIHENLPVAPVDIHRGSQRLDLLEPLVARSPGARLILFVRAATGAAPGSSAALAGAVPPGAVRAVLTGANGRELHLEHTDYTDYQGFRGLVLTGEAPGTQTPALYLRLDVESSVALEDVRVVWLNRAVVNVRDVHSRL